MPQTVLCLASYEKGHEFLRECKHQGWHVVLVTSASLQETHWWPEDGVDEVFFMPDQEKRWERTGTILGVSYLARTRQFDRLVPLDDFDLEMAAALREHLRLPGMGETTTRYFRDKLAMRLRAAENGLAVPAFTGVMNDDHTRAFTARIPPPWVLKPRLLAGAIGIKKIQHADQLWPALEALGDERSFYLLERFIPGDIFHVDSIVSEREILFAVASQYGHPPLEVSHGGGIFTTQTLPRGEEIEQGLLAKNRQVLTTMGLLRGVSHTEFIRAHADGRIYFLETSARVGGANIADLVEASTGVNMWAEWAKVELAGGKSAYELPPVRTGSADLLVSLARQEYPDLSVFDDPEVVWRMRKKHHVGLVVRSERHERVTELLESYARRVQEHFHAAAPPQTKPTY